MKSAAFPPDLQQVRDAVRPLCQRHSVARLQVFGSLARGETQPGSDVDFLVEFLPDAPAGLLEMGGLKEDLEETLGCPVDLVSRPAVERSPNPYRRRSILAAPVTVYG
ncbi:MAG: nucleotidyltransferase family protein [Prosthecobacter sp.]|nr:nucleotidyltransferase family protein [Prosthecobacter sp.]